MAEVLTQKLGRYLLLNRIASGGMAEVYRGKLIGIEGFEKDVAIKRILPHWSEDRNFVEMLVDEAKVLVHLNHANIVSVYELNKDEETYFIVMEYVSGMDLRRFTQCLGAKALDLPLALYIAKNILQGLAYAHDKKDRDQELRIVHRDISPQNILLSAEGEVKITDFGIARVFGKSTETVTGTLKGKFAYMSPEQAVGEKVDWRTDLFAMGILLYEMSTGQRCFKGENDFETLEMVRKARVSLPPQAGLPAALELIVLKALEKQREARYQSAQEMIADLESFERSLGQAGQARDLRMALSPHLEPLPAPTAPDDALTQIKTHTPRQTRVLVASRQLPDPDEVPTVVDAGEVPVVVPVQAKKKERLWPVTGFLGLLIVAVLAGYFWKTVPVRRQSALPVSLPEVDARPAVAEPPVAEPPVAEPPVAEPPVVESTTAPPSVKAEVKTPPENKPQVFGSLSVSAKPWGLVTIAGIVNGAEAPVSRPKVPAGNYSVRVRYPPLGKIVSTNVRISENSLVKCFATFAEPARITCH